MITLLMGAALGIMLLASAASAAPDWKSGGAAFPGRNGELVFAVTNRSRYYPDLYLMHPDGTGGGEARRWRAYLTVVEEEEPEEVVVYCPDWAEREFEVDDG